MAQSQPSNMQNFTETSYNLESKKAPSNWCVKQGSIYTNPQANFNYFNKQCGDPYTYYGYWYRRFPNQNKYLNCYYLPQKDPMLNNKYGYINNSNRCGPSGSNMRWNTTFKGERFFDSVIVPGKVVRIP